MWSRFILLVFFIGLTIQTPLRAQTIDTLIFCGIDSIGFQQEYKGYKIEELSGIDYSGYADQYLLIPQSKDHTHIFISSIKINEGLSVTFDSTITWNVPSLEGESIRINPASNKIYVAEETNEASYIHEVNERGELKTVYSSKGPFRHNSGFEGLCFSPDGQTMYVSLERPLKGNVTTITSVDLTLGNEKSYTYSLDVLPKDKRSDNGISEILTVNDSTLLIVERAFLGPRYGNSIRVYRALIPDSGTEIVKEKLLTDFSASPLLDNIEGVCYSVSGNELIFVSDNNGNSHQRTLFICMKIE